MIARRLTSVGLAACFWSSASVAAPDTSPQAPASEERRDLTRLSLSELASIQVTSVSKRPEERFQTAAAISVITKEDIRRSAAKSLPELLRYALGVDVARVDASHWAIGIRGFTSNLARSQLVLIDGRSVYTPLFAGTYWDVQDVLLEDIERIEVIRGPGGTLWGANAVNGVINIITRSATDTEGGLLAAGGGDEERAFGGARYGGKLGERGSYRAYGKYFQRDAQFHATTDNFDDWHMYRGGFRSDWDFEGGKTLTLQGDLYAGRAGQRTTLTIYEPPFSRTVEQEADLGGGSLRARFGRRFRAGSELTVQAYYDRTHRREASFREDRDTFDLDTQYRFLWGGRQEVVAGLGYRASYGRTAGVPTIVFTPPNRTNDLFSAFVQDTITLVPDRLHLTLGSKVERNDYTGFEFQPTARLGWLAGQKHFVWAAFTRAVRTPSRVERDLTLEASLSQATPFFARLAGNDEFETERMLGSEVGYRGRLSERAFLDVAAFYNRYPNLLSLETGAPFAEQGRSILPFREANGLEGEVSGAEVGLELRPYDRWQLRAGYSYLNMELRSKPGSTDRTSAAAEDASPRHSVFVWSSLDLPSNWLLDAWYRWVARRPSQNLRAYSELDLRLARKAGRHLQLAVVGRNLLHAHHAEFGSLTEIERAFYGEATWRW